MSESRSPAGRAAAQRPAAVVILAAGGGTRMKSALPKVLHTVCGRTMLDHVLAAARETEPVEIVVVVGHERERVMAHLAASAPDAHVVVQERQQGTGHAVRTALESVTLPAGTVLVTYGDTPALRGATLAELAGEHARRDAAVTALTAVMADPTGYGRILRDERGQFAEIVEEPDATPAQRRITEVNSGIYAFDTALLADALKRVATGNAKGEEYLTDVVGILRRDGHEVASLAIADCDEARGVNDRAQLAEARRVINSRLLAAWMRAGVTVADPATTSVDASVRLAPETELGPATQLEGTTTVERGARVGPGCLLRDTSVGPGAVLTHAVCESATIGAGAVVGPFVHLPPGTQVAAGERVVASTALTDLTARPTVAGAAATRKEEPEA